MIRKILFINGFNTVKKVIKLFKNQKNQDQFIYSLYKKISELNVVKQLEDNLISGNNLIISLIFDDNKLYGINVNRKQLQNIKKELNTTDKSLYCIEVFRRFDADKSLFLYSDNFEEKKKEIINFILKTDKKNNTISYKIKKL